MCCLVTCHRIISKNEFLILDYKQRFFVIQFKQIMIIEKPLYLTRACLELSAKDIVLHIIRL